MSEQAADRRHPALRQFIRPATDNSMWRTIYHIDTGPAETYAIDAREAVAKFPGEWSFDPWPKRSR